MLTKDKIKANPALTGLSDDQLSAIETLSQNDEQDVLNHKIGEIHGKYDQDIKAITGQEKPAGIKTYDHLKTVLTTLKGKVESLGEHEQQIQTLKGEISTLKKQIKDGSTDETLKTQLKTAQDELKSIQDTFKTEKTEWETKLSEKDQALTTFKRKSTLESAVKGFKFKPADIIPEDIRDLTIKNAIATVMSEYEIEESDGKIVFKKDGNIVRDANDSLNPMSANKILEPYIKSLIDTGQPGGGGGGKPPAGGTPPVTTLQGARTQMEANEVIEKGLLAKGTVKGSAEWTEQFDKIYKENDVGKLPIR